MDLLDLVPAIFIALLLVATTYVLIAGEAPERAGILAIAVGSFLTGYFAQVHVWRNQELGIFIVDVATLVAFIIIMASSNRYWPLWITAFQWIAVFTHIARFLSPRTVPMAYAIAEQVWAYLMIAIIVVAVRRRATLSSV